MSQGFNAADFQDLIALTQKRIQRVKYVDITQVLQGHSSAEIMKRSNVEIATGTGYQWQVKVGTSLAARNCRWGEVIQSTIGDYMTTASVGWHNTNTHYSISNQAMAANSGPEQIVNMVKVARHAALVSYADKMEANLWSTPTGSSDDLAPLGIPFWAQKYSGTPGFSGGRPSGFTTVANIDPNQYDGWKNWAGLYVNVSQSDLIDKMQDAVYKTGFKPPLPFEDLTGAKGENRYRIYCTYTTRKAMEVVLVSQNDNLGKEVLPFYNAAMFRQMPIVAVPYLDQNTTDYPVYGIDWKQWKICFLKGFFMNESKPMTDVLQPQVQTVHVDSTYEVICLNRRTAVWVLSK